MGSMGTIVLREATSGILFMEARISMIIVLVFPIRLVLRTPSNSLLGSRFR